MRDGTEKFSGVEKSVV